ncbi:hypothetical protein HT746_01445 [Burkholderia pyrrocinia]|uniref:hypothetical protein n=1 Tax=Burkholderia pyrrocinia TaxID=60550 RepID=UPI00157628E0|nr:hypothetical protein [Burkholderia pyrrocinia]NTX25824.1 hypothetical protein [Burkholderia pyrrocinia]
MDKVLQNDGNIVQWQRADVSATFTRLVKKGAQFQPQTLVAPDSCTPKFMIPVTCPATASGKYLICIESKATEVSLNASPQQGRQATTMTKR